MSQHPINLLPSDSLKAYHRDRAIAVIGRIVFGVGILAVLVVVFVGSAGLYLKVLTDADTLRLEVIEGSEALRRAEALEEQINGFSQELVILRDLKTKQYGVEFLVSSIVDALPQGARLQRFQLVFEKDVVSGAVPAPDTISNAPTLHIQGVSEIRRDVLDFEDALVALDFVESIDAPISNIIQPEDSAFSFSLYLVPPAEALKVATEASEFVEEPEDILVEEPAIEEEIPVDGEEESNN